MSYRETFRLNRDDLEYELMSLTDEIKENVEWLYTVDNDEVESISIENLETILSRFFGIKIELKQ
jgi:hypothetical protein